MWEVSVHFICERQTTSAAEEQKTGNTTMQRKTEEGDSAAKTITSHRTAIEGEIWNKQLTLHPTRNRYHLPRDVAGRFRGR